MTDAKPSPLKLADFVRVGPVRYTISLVDEVRRASDGLDLMGDINADGHPSEIRIWKGLAPSRLFVTLLHELGHAVANQSGVGDMDDKVISDMAFAWAQILIDNPWIGRMAEGLADTMRRIEP